MTNEKESKKDSIAKKGLSSIARYFLIFLVAIGLLGACSGLLWYLLPAPSVVGFNEVNIEKTLSFNADFKVAFSSKMNQKSVEQAFSITPDTAGQFTWQSDTVLIFKPDQNLTIGEIYTVSVDTGAKNWLGKNMENKFSQEFTIVGPPQVSFASPISPEDFDVQIKGVEPENTEENTEETEKNLPFIKPNQAVTVMFDRPIRAAFTPEEELQDDSDKRYKLADYLIFEPEVKGEFKFLGTSSFQFMPDPDTLPMGQTIKITLKKGLPAADGGETEQEISWQIQTDAPKIMKTEPNYNQEYVNPEESIRIYWNQEMNTESLFKNLTITPDLPNDVKRTIEVAPEITEDGKENYKTTVISFKPNFPKDEMITMKIAKGVESLKGKKVLEDDYELRFFTKADPAVKSYFPTQDAQITPETEFTITLASATDPEKIKEKLFFEPAIDKEQISVDEGYSSSDIWSLTDDQNYESQITYTITVPLKAQTEYKWGLLEGLEDKDGQKLQEGFKSVFVTKNYSPSLQLLSRGGNRSLYDSDEDASIFIRSRNTDEVHFSVCQLSDSEVATIETNWSWWDDYSCPSGKQIKWTEKLANKANEWVVTEVPLSERIDLKNGAWRYDFYADNVVYYWDSNTPIHFSEGLFLVNASLTAKITNDKVLFWATDFLEGKPIKDMKISVYSENGDVVSSGETNDKGFLEINKPDEYFRFMAVGEKDDYKAYAGVSWDSGIAAWDFGFNQDWHENPYGLGYLFTDRPIYRPGQEVDFKGIVRLDHDANLSIPAGKSINVTIESPTGKELLNEDMSLSVFGSFDGKLSLDETAETGQYTLIARYQNDENDNEDWFSYSFWVEEYKKPDFKVDINANDKTYFLNKQDLKAEIDVSRYFGATMPDTQVSWYAVTEDYYFQKTDGWYSFSDNDNWCWWYCNSEQNVLAQGEGKTDANGKLEISFSVSTEKNSPQLLTLNVTATDSTLRTVTNRATFEIYPDNVLVGIRAQDYYLSGTENEAAFDMITVDPEGKAVSKQNVKVELYSVKWNSIEKEGVDGGFYWETNEELTKLDETNVSTDSEGKAVVKFAIDRNKSGYEGDIKAVATLGNYSSSASSYIASENYISWARNNNDRITIRTDKASYKVGDTANLIVESPFEEPVNALITIERQGILDYYTEQVESGKALKIEVTEDMLPNAFVSVVLMKGKGAESANYKTLQRAETIQTELSALEEEISKLEAKISTLQDELNSTADTENSRQNLLQKSINSANEELSGKKIEKTTLEDEKALLDKAVETIKAENKDVDISEAQQFVPEMKMGLVKIPVETDSKKLEINMETNQESYLPGDDVKLRVKVLDNNLNPVENTELSLAVVDESVLALKSRNLQDIIDFFWGERNLGVSTISSMVFFTERLNVEAQKGEKGGGGGDFSAADLATKKRGEFRDTAYWLPTIITDNNGEAEINFTLPDNLTTWQILAIGSTTDSKFGMQTKDFISKKKLMVTPSLPRFAVNGDHFTVGALINNQSDKDLDVKITLQAENFNLDNADPIKESLKAGEEKLVEFSGTANSQADQNGQFSDITLTFRAEDDPYLDEVEITIPVNAPAIGESVATSGSVEDMQSEFIKIPELALSGMGNLAITLSAYKTGDFTEGLEDLLGYPYGCAEQTMSKHLPNMLIKQLSDTLGDEFISVNEDSMKKYAEEGLQKIYSFQRSDGGFGYWEESDMSYPDLSAYILFGLQQTEKAGYTVDQEVKNNVIGYLKIALADKTISDSEKAFIVFVLSEDSNNELSMANILYDKRKELSTEGKIDLLLAFQNFRNQNLAGAFEKTAMLVSEVEAMGKQTDRGIQFEEDNDQYSYWNWSSDVRLSAMALYALSKENPDHVMIPKIVDYLQSSKQRNLYGGPWGTTQNTAWVLISYLEWLKDSGQLNPNYTATVHLNNELFAEKTWDKNTKLKSETFVAEMDKLNKSPLENEINFKKDGDGKLFYDIVANYYLPIDKVTEKNHGVGVVREYFAFDDKDMKTPVDKVEKGQLVRGKITVMIPETRNMLVVDSPLPAGLEAVNFALETEDQGLLSETDPNHCEYYWCWWDELWYFNHKEMRDDRILLFADYIPAGTYEYNFLARATTTGTFQLIPTTAEEMYHPETFGRTNGSWFEVYQQ